MPTAAWVGPPSLSRRPWPGGVRSVRAVPSRAKTLARVGPGHVAGQIGVWGIAEPTNRSHSCYGWSTRKLHDHRRDLTRPLRLHRGHSHCRPPGQAQPPDNAIALPYNAAGSKHRDRPVSLPHVVLHTHARWEAISITTAGLIVITIRGDQGSCHRVP